MDERSLRRQDDSDGQRLVIVQLVSGSGDLERAIRRSSRDERVLERRWGRIERERMNNSQWRRLQMEEERMGLMGDARPAGAFIDGSFLLPPPNARRALMPNAV